MAFPTLVVLTLGVTARLWLFRSSAVAQWLAGRSELATPLTSWKRVTEGLALVRAGVSPYTGDVYHETPLMLQFVSLLDNVIGSDKVWMAFLVADMLTGVLLSAVATEMAAYFIERQNVEKKR